MEPVALSREMLAGVRLWGLSLWSCPLLSSPVLWKPSGNERGVPWLLEWGYVCLTGASPGKGLVRFQKGGERRSRTI